jgi:hypothetical protein
MPLTATNIAGALQLNYNTDNTGCRYVTAINPLSLKMRTRSVRAYLASLPAAACLRSPVTIFRRHRFSFMFAATFETFVVRFRKASEGGLGSEPEGALDVIAIELHFSVRRVLSDKDGPVRIVHEAVATCTRVHRLLFKRRNLKPPHATANRHQARMYIYIYLYICKYNMGRARESARARASESERERKKERAYD